MSEQNEEHGKEAQIIQVSKKDIGVTQFAIDPSKGEKIVIVIEDESSNISN